MCNNEKHSRDDLIQLLTLIVSIRMHALRIDGIIIPHTRNMDTITLHITKDVV